MEEHVDQACAKPMNWTFPFYTTMLCFLPFVQIRHVLCLQEALFSSMLIVWLKATMKR
jgi:hypothetical protein